MGDRIVRILLVEDDEFVRDLVVGQLTALGHVACAVEDADAALRVLETEAFDLLMTDVMLPGTLDGHALAARVRERWPGMPVLYASGSAASAGAPAGAAVRHLQKPFRLQQLARAIDELLPGAATR